MAADKSVAKKVIEKYTRETDPEIIEATYRYGMDYIAPIPYPAKEGIVEIYRQSSHPKAKTANPDDFINMSLVKKLEDGGFFRRVLPNDDCAVIRKLSYDGAIVIVD